MTPREAVETAKGNSEPIHLILQRNKIITTDVLDYHDGEHYPSLVRVDGTADYLDDITKPCTKTEKYSRKNTTTTTSK